VVDAVRELGVRPPGQVPALDALRTLAIAMVVASHAAIRWTHVGSVSIPATTSPFFYWGWTGVDLFFVLSGFLIGKQLWRELEATGTIRFGRFLLRRGLRIWPLYVCFVLWPVILGRVPLTACWRDLLFVSNYFVTPVIVAGGWSLSTEEQFYVLVPALMLLLKRWLPLRAWPLVLLGLMALEVGARALTSMSLAASGLSDAQIGDRMTFAFHLRSEPLFVGLAIALASVLWPRRFERKHGFSLLGLGLLAACLAGAAIVRRLSGHVFAFTALSLVFGGMTLFALWDGSRLARVLGMRGFHVLSRLSYGMYLNHFFFVRTLMDELTLRGIALGLTPTLSFLASYVIVFAISAGFSVVTFLVIERPFLRWRERLFPSPAGPSAVSLTEGREGRVSWSDRPEPETARVDSNQPRVVPTL
jgi:peptidoglycan/LPS O-acetylase OafA/YrhL